MEYNPYLKTAIVRKGMSKPMKVLKEKGLLQGNILDYGCGCGEDVSILSEIGFDIVGYDKFNNAYEDKALLDKKYGTVVCSYVLNVIPSIEEHKQVLELLKKLSDNIYICVRSDVKAIRDTWEYNEWQQGYWTSNNSFQRFYNVGMIEELIGEVEYISNNGSFKLFRLK